MGTGEEEESKMSWEPRARMSRWELLASERWGRARRTSHRDGPA